MNIGYIKVNNKNNILKYCFNLIDTKEEKNKKIYIIPKRKNEIKENFKKIVNKIKLDKIKMVILSSELKENQKLKEMLEINNIKVLDGRYLFKWLIIDVIEYIAKMKNSQIENEEVTILINNIENKDIQNIIQIAKKCKTINLVVNKAEKFKKLEDYLQNEFGIIINVYNFNSIKSINKGIVINFDFGEEKINKLKFEQNPIIVNVLKKIMIKSKKFNGININYYGVNIEDELEYEAKIYREYDFNSIRKIIKKDEVKIEYLIGNKGQISNQEFIKINT